MNLESLANELLLDLFEFLPVVHLFRAFYGLNSRFDTLLLIHYRNYCIDFRSVSKRDFDIVCQKYLPLIGDRIISLRLSDDNETPKQTNLFLSYKFNFRQFTNLQSLTLSHLYSKETLRKLMIECHYLPHLTHLTFTECEFKNQDKDISDILNNIWNLPKLIHCHFHSRLENCTYMNPLMPSVTSTSLEYFSIDSYSYNLNDLACLFQHTPRLRHLSIEIWDHSLDRQLSFTVPSITVLNVKVYKPRHAMMNLLQNVPNLHHLIIETYQIIINGHEWEEIIVKNLIMLKKFQLEMWFKFDDDDNKEQRIDELLNSFRTHFWLEERQWFVRCDWDQCQWREPYIDLYTLPYFQKNYYFYETNFRSKSTCPNDNDYWSYDHVKNLECMIKSPNKPISHHIHFSNIRYLTIYLPVDDEFWIRIPRFDQLISLEITWNDHAKCIQSQLQLLLDRAPRLNSLSFQYSPTLFTQVLSVEYISKSIRQLHFKDMADYCINGQQCTLLSHSPLGIQCEVLSISVENRTNVIDLINTMTNLRALNVLCRDDTRNYDDRVSLSKTDELIEWLQHQLPSTCIITRDKEDIYISNSISFRSILIWIC
jgi:hypothetical protein